MNAPANASAVKPMTTAIEKPVKLRRKWKHYGLRTCNADGTAYRGFVWPEKGLVECPDWKPSALSLIHI